MNSVSLTIENQNYSKFYKLENTLKVKTLWLFCNTTFKSVIFISQNDARL